VRHKGYKNTNNKRFLLRKVREILMHQFFNKFKI